VQADDNSEGLFIAQKTAVDLGATVISNSWGAPEEPGTPSSLIARTEAYLDQPVAIFAAAGDRGYNDGGEGPDYPATSAHVIAVGGTRLLPVSNARGWLETAWSNGGSACSLSIPKPAYQTTSPCAFKATADIAAVGDPASGVSVYNARTGGWIIAGGTSASSPLVASIYAATGNGAQTSGAFLGANTGKLNDVTLGNNGTCGSMTVLCNAGVGWDGPTGYGTPNGVALLPPGFELPPDEEPGGGGDSGGCSTGGAGPGAGLLLGLALLARRRRR
jgi:MYXO-CTERM domain-containing protein